MRVSKEKAAQNRRRILVAAARLFRENGIDSSGVDAITEKAGLTHGAFYSQFDSKEAVAAEAIHLALEGSRRVFQKAAEGKNGRRALARIVDAYLAPLIEIHPGTAAWSRRSAPTSLDSPSECATRSRRG